MQEPTRLLTASNTALTTIPADTVAQLANTLNDLHVPFEDLSAAVTPCSTEVTITGSSAPSIVGSRKSWLMNYTVVSFMMNVQLFAEYDRLSHMLNLPPCSDTQWQRITEWLGQHVTELAEWSCEQVREEFKEKGDHHHSTASFLSNERPLL